VAKEKLVWSSRRGFAKALSSVIRRSRHRGLRMAVVLVAVACATLGVDLAAHHDAAASSVTRAGIASLAGSQVGNDRSPYAAECSQEGQIGNPLPGDYVIFCQPGSGVEGHVAVVETVNSDGTITTIRRSMVTTTVQARPPAMSCAQRSTYWRRRLAQRMYRFPDTFHRLVFRTGLLRSRSVTMGNLDDEY
jgi:hypothetical protein